MQNKLDVNEPILITEDSLQDILEKISKSANNSVFTATAPNTYVAELVHNQLVIKGVKASRYENVIRILVN